MIQISLGLELIVASMHNQLIASNINSNSLLDDKHFLKSFSLFCDLNKRCLPLSEREERPLMHARVIALVVDMSSSASDAIVLIIAPPTNNSLTSPHMVREPVV